MRIYICAPTPQVPRPAWASAAGSRATTPPGPIRQGALRSWGSGSPDQVGDGIDFGIEQRFEAGSELAVEDSALEQEIGAAAGPPHLLRFVHAAIDQEVGGAFGDRRADPQAGTMAFGIVDQPGTLTGEIAVDLAQRRPQPT